MQLKYFFLKNWILKLLVGIIILYTVLVGLSLATTLYLFLNLNNYKHKISQVLLNYTGYQVTIGEIKSTLNGYLLPQLELNNLHFTDWGNNNIQFNLKQIKLVLSYKSIIYLEPIFQQINISGTDLTLSYLNNNSFLINGIDMNHPQRRNKHQTHVIDVESWLLKQQDINLNNINLSILDYKHNLPKMYIYNVNILLHNEVHNHHFRLTIGQNQGPQPILGVDLSWIGGKISQLQQLAQAHLQIQTYSTESSNLVSKYIPKNNSFHGETTLNAEIRAGKLQYLHANFDINNLHNFLTTSHNSLFFTRLGGNININLVNGNKYIFLANNLSVDTIDGHSFNNQRILGTYVIGKYGNVSLQNTNITFLNTILSIFNMNNLLNMSGILDVMQLQWVGNITHPQSYNVITTFHDFTLISYNPKIPSITNVTGTVNLNQLHGNAQITLHNSTFNDPKIFLLPFIFKSLTTNISWMVLSNKTTLITLAKTPLITSDFAGVIQGTYIYSPHTSGFIDLTASVERILMSKIGGYLPKVIGIEVHQWLKDALINGYATQAKLHLKGFLHEFPFNEHQGIFYIDTNVINGQLDYVKDWPTINNMMGTFQIRNRQIIINAHHAITSNVILQDTHVVIPNMTNKGHVMLTVDGTATGVTKNFMLFLSHSPINNLINKFPEKIDTVGNGMLHIHLNIPLSNPHNIAVNGSYTMYNNRLSFHDLLLPELVNINGNIFFTQHGISIDKINLVAFQSKAILSEKTDANNLMHFTLDMAHLNLQLLSQLYVSWLTPVLSGTTPIHATWTLDKAGLKQILVQSNLLGAIIDAPFPLHKTASVIKTLQIKLLPANLHIVWDYAHVLSGNLLIGAHKVITSGFITLGEVSQFNVPHNNIPIQISINVSPFNVNNWLATILKIYKQHNQSNNIMQPHTRDDRLVKPTVPDKFNPIYIQLNTNNLLVNEEDYLYTTANVLILPNMTLFNANNTLSNGVGSYTYSNHHLDIVLNDFNILKSLNGMKKTYQNNQVAAAKLTVNLNQLPIKTSSGKHKSDISVAWPASIKMHSTPGNLQSKINFPNTTLLIKSLYFENVQIATAQIKLHPQGSNILIQNGLIDSVNTHTTISGMSYCYQCANANTRVVLNTNTQVFNLGNLLNNLGYTQYVVNGSGNINAQLNWPGQIQNFKLANLSGNIDINLKEGKLLKINKQSILGTIIGIINLQTVVSLANFNFGKFFADGFYFNVLKVKSFVHNNLLNINSLYMDGPLATIQSYGKVDIDHNIVDIYLNVVPKVGDGIAVGAAVATLNPLTGIAVYVGEKLLGNPLNKLFSFAYHITGSLQQPTIVKVEISKQILNNLQSTVGLH